MTKYKDVINGLILMSTLLGSGVGLGYWYRGTETDVAHKEEIERLQASHNYALAVLSGKIGQAAERIDDAAARADKAAKSAAKAADRAARPDKKEPAADSRSINQAVKDANKKIGGEK